DHARFAHSSEARAPYWARGRAASHFAAKIAVFIGHTTDIRRSAPHSSAVALQPRELGKWRGLLLHLTGGKARLIDSRLARIGVEREREALLCNRPDIDLLAFECV